MVLTYILNDFEMVPVAPIITGITPVSTSHIRCISTVRSLYFKIFPASFLNHIPVSWNCNIYQHTCSLFIIAYYNVWLVNGDGPVSLYLMVPQYGYLTSSTCFYWFWYMFIPVFLLLLLLLLLLLYGWLILIRQNVAKWRENTCFINVSYHKVVSRSKLTF
jgi:hypothetical protein